MPVNGLSASQLASFRAEAQRLVNKYDRSGDNAIDQSETARRISMGPDSYSFTTRVSDAYVERTTVFQENFTELKSGEIAEAGHGAGRASADDLVESYLERKDTNHDGKLSWWEKLSTSVGGMRDMFEAQTTVETGRRTDLEYDPVYVPPSPGPIPPSPTGRPLPPSPSSRPTPPSPSSRPTPPSPSERPAPPSPSERPTPPSPSSRPTPPAPTPSSRPTPPSPTSSGRPTPPHA